MTQDRYLELVRIAARRADAMRRARAAHWRAVLSGDRFIAGHMRALMRQECRTARTFNQRLIGAVRKWNADADAAYAATGAIVCKLSTRLVTSVLQ